MKNELFNELLESVREGAAIIKGEKKPSRSFSFGKLNVIKIRKNYGLTQNKFAKLLGISVGTLKNWEQGRRKPEGSAKVLLGVAARHPESLLDTVNYYFQEKNKEEHS